MAKTMTANGAQSPKNCSRISLLWKRILIGVLALIVVGALIVTITLYQVLPQGKETFLGFNSSIMG